MKTSYKIATVWGIPIRVHISLLLLMAYFSWQAWNIDQDLTDAIMSLAMSVFIFGSIALHELGHSFVALRKDCPVRDITLMFLGGAARLERIPKKPRDEILMALAGPAVSLFLGLSLLGLALSPLCPGPHKLIVTVAMLGALNIFFAVFNLIPSFPMDGGRVLRACLVKRHGRVKATYIASKLARVIAVIFIIAGIRWINTMPFLMLIGVFVFTASKNEYLMVVHEEKIKERGHHTWFSYGPTAATPPPPPAGSKADHQTAEIGPAPYDRGRGTQSDVHHES
jgi:Zn-dependent protease